MAQADCTVTSTEYGTEPEGSKCEYQAGSTLRSDVLGVLDGDGAFAGTPGASSDPSLLFNLAAPSSDSQPQTGGGFVFSSSRKQSRK